MRRSITSAAVIVACAAALGGAGTFAVFNDTASGSGQLATGTVDLALDGEAPDTGTLALLGSCANTWTDSAHPDPAHNMGGVNNTSCLGRFTVHNAGSLPFELSGSQLSDTIEWPEGVEGSEATCFSSAFVDGATADEVVEPGEEQVVIVRTRHVSDAAECKGATDHVSIALLAQEARPGEGPAGDDFFTVGSTFTGIDPSTYFYGTSGDELATLVLTFADGTTATLSTGDSPVNGDSTQGWWNRDDGHFGGVPNYIAGLSTDAVEYRNYFAFDVASLTKRVTSASLVVPNDLDGSPGVEVFWSVSTPINVLTTEAGPDAGVFGDLGGGTRYGAQDITPSTDSVVVQLNSRAIAHINRISGN